MGGGCGEGMCSGAAAMPKMRGGGCGDGMCSAGKVMGGSANLDLIPKDSFYKYNKYITKILIINTVARSSKI